MRIGIITPKNPIYDRSVWSGTVFKIRESIEKAGFEIVYIPIKKDVLAILYYIIYKLLAYICRKKSNPLYSIYISKRYAKYLDKQKISNIDYLLVPAMSPYIAYFDTSVPIIYLTDSTFKLYHDYYPSMTNITKKNAKEGLHIDKLTYNKSSIIICSSNWAKKSIVEDFDIDKNKVHILEFGPNIDIINENKIIKEFNKEEINMLFIGVNWKRKGGDIAVETCKEMRNLGFNTILNIVGCKVPNKYSKLPWIKEFGFLNKNDSLEYNKLITIIDKSDIFILPTVAEAAGIVFAESSAYSLPIFTFDTGGIGNYVLNGINGYRLNINSTGYDFARKIIECIKTGELNCLKSGCIKHYKSRLNWNIWSINFKKIINDIDMKNN